ncbi:aminoglycoside phosphotransferase family protein [Actinomadura sp. NPDC023710]|uniref:phosphotransferase enzyme family protein n=1 Tax=Actinomadura sp. NPDC023710 TaxID=3158219 RepID=UPI0033C57C2B
MTRTRPGTAQCTDEDVFTPENTITTLARACRAVGLDPERAHLMRLGSNAVYRVNASVIARISRKGTDSRESERAIAIARWLESADYPAVRAIDVEQPVMVDGRPVTFWLAVADGPDDWATTEEIADVIRRLHSLDAPTNLDLPSLTPFDKASERVNQSVALKSDSQGFLLQRLSELQDEWSKLNFELPTGIIHGDASVGNVLRDRNGVPTLMDLDSFATGPREWDLVLTALYYEHFGWHTRSEYEAFANTYGFDVMMWSGYPVMRDVREFLMVTWLAQKADESEETAAEAAKRIETLRTGGSRRDWKPW